MYHHSIPIRGTIRSSLWNRDFNPSKLKNRTFFFSLHFLLLLLCCHCCHLTCSNNPYKSKEKSTKHLKRIKSDCFCTLILDHIIHINTSHFWLFTSSHKIIIKLGSQGLHVATACSNKFTWLVPKCELVVCLNTHLQVGYSWFGKKEVDIFLNKSISWAE